MGNAIQRLFRLEGRASAAKCGALSFHFGGDVGTPVVAVGDAYAGITKLAVGSYTSPGTNSLAVTGAVSMQGWLARQDQKRLDRVK